MATFFHWNVSQDIHKVDYKEKEHVPFSQNL